MKAALRFALSVTLGLGVFLLISQREERRWTRRAQTQVRVPDLRAGDWFYFDHRLRTYLRAHLAAAGESQVVVCLGDSVTYCDGLSGEAAWPAVFDQIARTYQGRRRRYLNLGCNGTAIGYLARGLEVCATQPLLHRLVVLNPRNHCRFRWGPDLHPSELRKSFRPEAGFMADAAVLRGFGNGQRLTPTELAINRSLVAAAPWMAFYKEQKQQRLGLLQRIPRHSLRPVPRPVLPAAAEDRGPPLPRPTLDPRIVQDNRDVDSLSRYHPNTAQLSYLLEHLPGLASATSFALAPGDHQLMSGQWGLDPRLVPLTRKRMQQLGKTAGRDIHATADTLPITLFRSGDPVHLNNLGCWRFSRQLQRQVPFLRRDLPAFEILSPHPQVDGSGQGSAESISPDAMIGYDQLGSVSTFAAAAGGRAILEAPLPDAYLLGLICLPVDSLELEILEAGRRLVHRRLATGYHSLVRRDGQLWIDGHPLQLPATGSNYRIRIGIIDPEPTPRKVMMVFTASFLFPGQGPR